MANSPYYYINKIYNSKGQWDNADKAGDTAAKNNIAAKTQQYYRQLRSDGYGDIADELAASNYTQAKAINDKWAKTGKNPTRDYLYSLGKGYGMSKSDIDNLIGWDNQTGEVSFGGKKIGKPDAVVDGVSYWGDTSILDSAFDDYIKRSGTTVSDEMMSRKNTSEVNTKINDLWGIQTSDHNKVSNMWEQEYNDLKETNPFTTDEAKAILAKYDLSGLQGRDNEAASGGASNGGNIDSYAAANALRQQAALVNQGQMVVLEAHNKKLENARAILERLGVYQQGNYASMQNTIGLQQNESQRLFENSETAKNNKTDRLVKQSDVTGYVPNEWTIKNDSVYSDFLNEDGSFNKEKENVDIQALIDRAKSRGDTDTVNKLAYIRYKKIMDNYGAYGKYIGQGDINTNFNNNKTESARQFDENNETAKMALENDKYNTDATVQMNSDNIASNENIAKIEAQNALDQINAQTQGQKEVIRETAKNSDTGDKYGAYNTLLSQFDVSDMGPRKFIMEILKPYYDGAKIMSPGELPVIIKNNAYDYGLSIDNAKRICWAYNYPTEWLKGYDDNSWREEMKKYSSKKDDEE